MKSNVKLTILEAMDKGYHKCSFVVGVDEKSVIKKKRGDSDPAVTVSCKLPMAEAQPVWT